jgi:hypothetical protein
MGARSGGGGGGLSAAISQMPRGGFKTAPFPGAAKVGDLKDGDKIMDKNGRILSVAVAKTTKTQSVIGVSNGSGLGTTWMVSNKNNFVAGTKL